MKWLSKDAEGHLFNQQLLCLSLLLSYKVSWRYHVHYWFQLPLIWEWLQNHYLTILIVLSAPEVHFSNCRYSLRCTFLAFSLLGWSALPNRLAYSQIFNFHLFSTDCQICMSSLNAFWAPAPCVQLPIGASLSRCPGSTSNATSANMQPSQKPSLS